MVHNKYPTLFSPIKIGSLTVKNRIESAPVNISNLTQRSYLTPENILVFEGKARGGAGIVHMGECRVDAKTGISHKLVIPLDDPEILPYLHAATDAIKRHNAIAAVELIHPGTRSNPEYYDGPIWGPSDGPGHLGKDYVALDHETIDYIVDCFGNAAEMAKLGGVQMVMIHAGHGWLLHQFLSPLNNRRTDEYGGCLENRARITLRVIEDIRRKCGPDFPIEVRMSGTEYAEGGLTLEDQIEFAKLLDGKVDLINVTCGTFHVPSSNQHMIPSMFLPNGCNVYLAEGIKKVLKHTPVSTAGAISDPNMMEELLASGKIDMVAMARNLLADPDFPNKLKEGREDEIMPCQRCMACISESFVPYVKYPSRIRRCMVNPEAYKEGPARFIQPAKQPKTVLVAGGGPAGMEAAIKLADRGHKVILCEKSDRLGGMLSHSEYVPFKKEAMLRFRDALALQVQRRDIDLRLNTEVTPQLAQELKPDVVVAAMGAKPVIPAFAQKPGVVMATEALQNQAACGQNVVIVGAGQLGCELALLLGQAGRKVTLVDRKPEICRDAVFLYRDGLLTEMGKVDITVLTETECVDADAAGVTLADGRRIAADTVVAATGFVPREEEAEALRDCAFDFWRIGDCFKVRRVFDAMREGYNAGNYIP